MKHPDACLPQLPAEEESPFQFEKVLCYTNDIEQKHKNLLKWSFWMHNARGSFNKITRTSYFLRKRILKSDDIPDPSNAPAHVYKEQLSNDVHSFFKQMWKVEPHENQQDLVSVLFFGCFLLVFFIVLSDGHGFVRPHW